MAIFRRLNKRITAAEDFLNVEVVLWTKNYSQKTFGQLKTRQTSETNGGGLKLSKKAFFIWLYLLNNKIILNSARLFRSYWKNLANLCGLIFFFIKSTKHTPIFDGFFKVTQFWEKRVLLESNSKMGISLSPFENLFLKLQDKNDKKPDAELKNSNWV